MRPLVQEPMKTRSIAISVKRGAGLEGHVLEGALEGLAIEFVAWRLRGREQMTVTGATMPGLVPQLT